MSTKFELHFTKSLDAGLLDKGVKIWIIRIMGLVKFKTKKGWSRVYEAIIDTGAPVSLLPLSIWKGIDAEVATDYRISGVVPDKRCSLPVKVGNVTCVVMGRKAISREIKMKAYLTLTDKVPLIIGFDNFLTHFRLNCDYKNKRVYLEEE